MTKRITTCHYVLYYADPSLPYAVSALVSQSDMLHVLHDLSRWN